jgi:hypothetical protein
MAHLTIFALTLGAMNMAGNDAAVRIDAGALRITLSATGHVVSLYDTLGKRELLPVGKQPPLLYMTVGGRNVMPTAMAKRPEGEEIVFGDSDVTARVRLKVHPTHVRFELVSVTGCAPDHIYWGPYPTILGKSVGEIIAVVRDDTFAVGLQGLNLQTNGGANKTDAGGDIVASAAENDGGVKGSAIALFGCAAKDALATIGRIEVAEGLPHPMLDGVWAKQSQKATFSYMIVPYGEGDIAEYCKLAKQAGLQFVYHPGPFETWGHFKLNPGGFPRGDETMKTCVQVATTYGIGLGVHTLTAFITTNDPYVTPVPDPRLGRLGSSTLSAAIDDKVAEIPVGDREAFVKTQNWGWSRKFVLIGQEIAEYADIADNPLRLVGCKRGMFGTKASAHDAGADIGHLATHNYQTFYPGIDNGMADEMADRLIELFNATGLRMMSFDGMEGLYDYGHGTWAAAHFVQRCYDGWKTYAISDASGLLHFLWHDHTRMNWGEPWGKAVREGMPEQRFANQDLFDRNLFPHMLGWFELRATSSGFEATTLDDMEWVLSKGAGFNAGFALVSDLGSMKANALTPTILDAVREWEAARNSGAFSMAQRERLKSTTGEWHLEAAGKGRWKLWPVAFSKTLTCAGASAEWAVENKFKAQPLRFTLRVTGPGTIKDPTFEIGGQRVTFATEIKPGQYFVWEGSGKATVCDANWHELSTVEPSGAADLPTASQTVKFTCDAAAATQLTARFRTLGDPESVGRR